jgi:DNA-binding transcriptional ArsR family regulator
MTLQARRDVFQAIADPTRRDIMMLIANQSLNLNAIAAQFDVSRSAVSQHIKILNECGLIMMKQQGRERYCEIQPQQLAEIAGWIEPFRKLWEERFSKIDELLNQLKSKKDGQ